MGDPTGLLGAAVAKLLDVVIEEAKKTINFRKSCKALADLLKNIQPLVASAAANRPRDLVDDVDGTVLTGSRAVEKWYKDLEGVLKEAHSLVVKCNESRHAKFNVLYRNRMSSKILAVMKQIQEISTIQAPLAALSIMQETLREVKAKNAKEIAQLQLDVNIRAVGDTTRVILEVEEMDPTPAFQVIKSQTDPLAASVCQTSSSYGSSEQADREADLDDMSSYNLRPVPEAQFIVGMDVPLARLQDLLLGDSTTMRWVGAWGKGGIGKTLLAERAYNSDLVQDHFKKETFWLTVGRQPSIYKLQKNLCRMLDSVRINSAESEKETQTRILNALRGKKVLLVLDDVWEDDGVPVIQWFQDVPPGWDSGSKILVTTRNLQVLERIHAADAATVRMERLSDPDSWELFCKYAFGGVKSIPSTLLHNLVSHLELKLSLPTAICMRSPCSIQVREVADECKGLPLALKVIAGAQAGQKTTEQWQRALSKLKEAETLSTEHEIQLYNRLQLSYDALDALDPGHPGRLKKCFIYFAGFAEDSDIHVDKLLELWAGEKLLETRDETGNDPSPDGYFLLGLLIGRSLIDLHKGRWSHQMSLVRMTCRIHDVLRDLALHLVNQRSASMDCLFRAGRAVREFPGTWLTTPTRPSILGSLGLVPPSRSLRGNVTHLSLNDNVLESLPTKLKAPCLEVLLLARNNAKILGTKGLVVPPGFLESFSNLKVLDFESTNITSLPDSLGNLTNLIYLNLSFTGLRRLPVGLRKLGLLERLSLQSCGLEPWPFDISLLKRLSSLNTKGCGDSIWEPRPGVRSESDSLVSLCSLTLLTELSIGRSDRKHLPSKMSSLVNLRHLSISYMENLLNLPPELHTRNEPQLSKLQYLDLNFCMALTELPSWIDSLAQLSNLNLAGCSKLKSLPNLHKLEGLRTLNISLCRGLQQLPAGFASSGAFPALMELSMMNCVGLQEFPPIEEGAFPQLTYLDLTGCAYMKLPSSLRRLPSLVRLRLNLCRNLRSLDDCFWLEGDIRSNYAPPNDPTSRDGVPCLPYFTNLQELGLKDVTLVNLPPYLAACPALKRIDIRRSVATVPENLRILQGEGKLTIAT